MLCVLYFTCILFVFLINAVTLCESHSEIKGYLLTYLLDTLNMYRPGRVVFLAVPYVADHTRFTVPTSYFPIWHYTTAAHVQN